LRRRARHEITQPDAAQQSIMIRKRNEMDIRHKPHVAGYILLSLLITGAIWGTIGPPRRSAHSMHYRGPEQKITTP
jgi:hypothetical protein